MLEDCNVGCFCCVFGLFSVIVYIDRGGYCFGELIGVSVVINNYFNNEIFGFEIYFI